MKNKKIIVDNETDDMIDVIHNVMIQYVTEEKKLINKLRRLLKV